MTTNNLLALAMTGLLLAVGCGKGKDSGKTDGGKSSAQAESKRLEYGEPAQRI